MSSKLNIYIQLQQHLDNQAIGFPATKSGAELKILKHIFTPHEAQIAKCLTYKFEPLETVFQRAGHLADSKEEFESHLSNIQKKGGIESKIKDGKKLYCNSPLVVGMYELQVDRLSKEFIEDFNAYTSDKKFGIDFLSTELPQIRTIPVARSIQTGCNVSNFDEISHLVKNADPPFAVVECICRKKKEILGNPCKVTKRKETCLALGDIAQTVLLSDMGREISREETLAILDKNQKQGLVIQPANSKKAEFICSCCGCCCSMLSMFKDLPKPLDFWSSNYFAVIDHEKCNGCGVCKIRCHVGAIQTDKKNLATPSVNRCIGCGVCVPTCPEKAITLMEKSLKRTPPETREDLHEIIMAKKKGKLQKLRLTGKIVKDALFTGHINLILK